MQATLPTNMQPTYLHASQVHASICVAKFQARFHNPHPGRRSYIRPKTVSNWSIGRMIWNPEGSQWYEEAPCKAVKACLCSSLGVTPMIRNPEGSQWYEEAPREACLFPFRFDRGKPPSAHALETCARCCSGDDRSRA